MALHLLQPGTVSKLFIYSLCYCIKILWFQGVDSLITFPVMPFIISEQSAENECMRYVSKFTCMWKIIATLRLLKDKHKSAISKVRVERGYIGEKHPCMCLKKKLTRNPMAAYKLI